MSKNKLDLEKEINSIKTVRNIVLRNIKDNKTSGLCTIITDDSVFKSDDPIFKVFRRLPKARFGIGGYRMSKGPYCFKWGESGTQSQRFYHYRLKWLDKQIRNRERKLREPWCKRLFKL